jgi:hypothetical protein
MSCKTVSCTEICEYFYVCTSLVPHATVLWQTYGSMECMYVCMYVCMHVCMWVCMYIFMYVFTYVFMYVCRYIFMYELESITFYNRAHWIPSITHILAIRLLENELSYHTYYEHLSVVFSFVFPTKFLFVFSISVMCDMYPPHFILFSINLLILDLHLSFLICLLLWN